MRIFSYFLFISLLLLSGVSAAQNDQPAPEKPKVRIMMGGMPGMPEFGHDWWRSSEVAQKIGLNDQQKQQLNDVFSEHRANLIQMRGNVEIEEGKLHDLLDKDQPQQDQVLAEVSQLQSARNTLEKEFTVMTLAFRNVLTPDQWKQLQSMTHDRMMHFRMRKPGPGGPGDGPPPLPPPPQD
jgi:Spy/CpxP family protein refolding chaperone